ncbi:MAG: 7-cyano-7-deazaguanine synthase QueC [Candidatus Omnitrophica bacterium]|nr:7-cyano-7-deazaguanine synthase QueC [Candidatus Omnitrophota bacterium]
MKSVALISGGIDSFVAAAYEKSKGSIIYALSVDYGQIHKKEIESAEKIGKFLEVKQHKFIKIDLSWLPSSLIDRNYKPEKKSEIPPTYVPARNIIFLSLALAYAESIDADSIIIGVHCLDYSGYPDCRPKFIEAFQKVVDTGIKKSVEGGRIFIRTPLILMKKSEIIKLGAKLGLDFSITWSCYKGEDKACGECDSCKIRIRAFSEAGLKDPIEYRK